MKLVSKLFLTLTITSLSLIANSASNKTINAGLPIEGDILFCQSDSVKTYKVDDAAGINFEWSVTNQNSIKADGNTAVITWKEYGKNLIKVSYSDAKGNKYQSELSVNVLFTPQPEFTFDYVGDNVYFSNETVEEYDAETDEWKACYFQWNFGRPDDEPVMVEWDTVISYQNAGTYNVEMTAISTNGCVASVSKSIESGVSSSLYVPTAFVPTAISNVLNKFYTSGENLSEYKIWVFDSWGNLVWYSDKLVDGRPVEGWDGTADGRELSSGMYFWRIEATLQNKESWKGVKSGNKYKKIGSILLIH